MSVLTKSRLTELEQIIERGITAFYEAGLALREIRDARLYEGFDTFEEYCQKRWGHGRNYANKLIAAAEVIELLGTTVPKDELPQTEREAREYVAILRKEGPEAIKQAWAEKRSVMLSSESPEWYTPAEVLDPVVALMGAIDLDPCSNGGESPNVPAGRHFTKADDGLSRQWVGRVFMNPPYGREIEPWVDKLISEYYAKRVTAAVALVPARVDTDWFRKFRDFAVCFVDGRLKFSGHENSAPFPSAAVYLGAELGEFGRTFSGLGDVWLRWRE